MRFDLIDHLPFVKIILINEGKESELANVLLDTGSASTVIPAEIAVELGLDSLPTDKILRIHGVGGMEYVYEKHIDKITLGSLVVKDVAIQVGSLDYGFGINGILGMDFMIKAEVLIDIKNGWITKAI
ncbi:MAG: retropepsin-like aspartic protease [Spirochaetota bacterium]